MSESRFSFRAAVYLIAKQEGKILLARRYNTGWQDGNYTLPAGHMDGNETIFTAMSREAQEETNLLIQPEDLRLRHTMHRKRDPVEYFDFYLEAIAWENEINNNEPHKCDDLRWFDMDNLPENTLEGALIALEKIARGESFSSFGF